MKRHAIAAALIMLLAVPTMALAGSGGKGSDRKHDRVVVVKRQGHAYCFERAIALGGAVVAGGRCYTFYLLRTHQGAFLAFGPPGSPMIPPGQIVRLSTPAGAKHRGRLFYLVPVSVPVSVIRVDEIRYVPVVVTPHEGRVVITVPTGGSAGQPSGGAQRDPELNFLER
jgi:hypothetical protein